LVWEIPTTSNLGTGWFLLTLTGNNLFGILARDASAETGGPFTHHNQISQRHSGSSQSVLFKFAVKANEIEKPTTDCVQVELDRWNNNTLTSALKQPESFVITVS